MGPCTMCTYIPICMEYYTAKCNAMQCKSQQEELAIGSKKKKGKSKRKRYCDMKYNTERKREFNIREKDNGSKTTLMHIKYTTTLRYATLCYAYRCCCCFFFHFNFHLLYSNGKCKFIHVMHTAFIRLRFVIVQ